MKDVTEIYVGCPCKFRGKLFGDEFWEKILNVENIYYSIIRVSTVISFLLDSECIHTLSGCAALWLDGSHSAVMNVSVSLFCSKHIWDHH